MEYSPIRNFEPWLVRKFDKWMSVGIKVTIRVNPALHIYTCASGLVIGYSIFRIPKHIQLRRVTVQIPIRVSAVIHKKRPSWTSRNRCGDLGKDQDWSRFVSPWQGPGKPSGAAASTGTRRAKPSAAESGPVRTFFFDALQILPGVFSFELYLGCVYSRRVVELRAFRNSAISGE